VVEAAVVLQLEIHQTVVDQEEKVLVNLKMQLLAQVV
jgi:hypothetical protein